MPGIGGEFKGSEWMKDDACKCTDEVSKAAMDKNQDTEKKNKPTGST